MKLIFLQNSKDKTKRKLCLCRYSKKLTCKGTLWQVFICLDLPPFLGFVFGWKNNFVGSEYGQNPLQNMVSKTTQHPQLLPTTHFLYILYFDLGKGGEVGELNHREGKRGNSSQSWFENTNLTYCISSL